jgi:hypothetical protein
MGSKHAIQTARLQKAGPAKQMTNLRLELFPLHDQKVWDRSPEETQLQSTISCPCLCHLLRYPWCYTDYSAAELEGSDLLMVMRGRSAAMVLTPYEAYNSGVPYKK